VINNTKAIKIYALPNFIIYLAFGASSNIKCLSLPLITAMGYSWWNTNLR